MAGFVTTTIGAPFSLVLVNSPVNTASVQLFVNGVRIPAPTGISGTTVTFAGLPYVIDSSDSLVINYVKA